jgi:hypothetical protein
MMATIREPVAHNHQHRNDGKCDGACQQHGVFGARSQCGGYGTVVFGNKCKGKCAGVDFIGQVNDLFPCKPGAAACYLRLPPVIWLLTTGADIMTLSIQMEIC